MSVNTSVAAPVGQRRRLAGLVGSAREYGIVAALVVIVLLFQGLTGGRLLQPDNISSLIQQNAYVFILAVGMLMVIVAGHIDLSAGSVVATVGGVAGVLMADYHASTTVAVIATLVAGLIIGAWQGFWIAYVGIPAFIVTLAGMLVFRGVALVLVGYTRAGFPNSFNQISNGGVAGWAGFVGQLDVFTIIVGVLGVVGFLFTQIRTRVLQRRRGLDTEPAGLFVGRLVMISVIAGLMTFWLAESALGLPYVLVIVGVVVVLYAALMGNTVFGRDIYAMGGNLAAARLSGEYSQS